MTEEEFRDNYYRNVQPHEYVQFLVLMDKIPKYEVELKQQHGIEVVSLSSGRMKDVDSALKKAGEENIELENVLDQMHDLAGVRVVVRYLSQVQEFYNCFIEDKDSGYWSDVSQPTDNIEQPREDGYRGFHFIVSKDAEIDGRNITGRCEVQIKTLYQHALSEKTHPLYKFGLLTGELAQRTKSHSDSLHNLENESEFLRDENQKVFEGSVA
ncbi:MAG: hypothetical protein ACE5PV_02540 [Candidatus Poribacteria bacterium]